MSAGGYKGTEMLRAIQDLPNEGQYTELKRVANERFVAGQQAFMAAQNLLRAMNEYKKAFPKPTKTADDSVKKYLSDKVVCALITFILADEEKNQKRIELNSRASPFKQVANKSNNSQNAEGGFLQMLRSFFTYDTEEDPISPKLKMDVASMCIDRMDEEATADGLEEAKAYATGRGFDHILLSEMFTRPPAATASNWEFPTLKGGRSREKAATFLRRGDVEGSAQLPLGSVDVGSFSMHPQARANAPLNSLTAQARLRGVVGSMAPPPPRTFTSLANRLAAAAGGSAGASAGAGGSAAAGGSAGAGGLSQQRLAFEEGRRQARAEEIGRSIRLKEEADARLAVARNAATSTGLASLRPNRARSRSRGPPQGAAGHPAGSAAGVGFLPSNKGGFRKGRKTRKTKKARKTRR